MDALKITIFEDSNKYHVDNKVEKGPKGAKKGPKGHFRSKKKLPPSLISLLYV